jgi:ribosome-binding factor A
MSTRLQKVEQVLRREIAEALLRGDLRDPRVQPIAAISITGVRVSPDLGSARVFVDALEVVDFPRLLAGLNAGAGAMRAALGPKLRMRRTPMLRFERDDSVDRGLAIERVLGEIAAAEAVPPVPEDDDDGAPET